MIYVIGSGVTTTVTINCNWVTPPEVGDILEGADTGVRLEVTERPTVGTNTVKGYANGNFDTSLSTMDYLVNLTRQQNPVYPAPRDQSCYIDGSSWENAYQGQFGLQAAIDIGIDSGEIYLKNTIYLKSGQAIDLDTGGIVEYDLWQTIIGCDSYGDPLSDNSYVDITGESQYGSYDIFNLSANCVKLKNIAILHDDSSRYGIKITAGSNISGLVLDNCRIAGMGKWIDFGGGFLRWGCFNKTIFESPTTSTDTAMAIKVKDAVFNNCMFDCSNKAILFDDGVISFYGNIVKNIEALRVGSDTTPILYCNTLYNATDGFVMCPDSHGTAAVVMFAVNNIVHLTNQETGRVYVWSGSDNECTVFGDYNASNGQHSTFWFFPGSGGHNQTRVSDLGFINPAGGDFRLKTDSVCFNRGMPTQNNGGLSIGAWQRKQNINSGRLIAR